MTVVYRMVYDQDWGMRGQRRIHEWILDEKPSIEMQKQLVANITKSEWFNDKAIEIEKIVIGKVRSTIEYYG